MDTGLPRRTAAQGAKSRNGRIAQAHGLEAEGRVCRALQHDGWTILDRRARTRAGEIDIVARRPNPAAPAAALIAFIEVKARRRLPDAAVALSMSQRRRLVEAAALMLADHPEWSECSLRFDLVLLDDCGRMRRIADAFRIGDD